SKPTIIDEQPSFSLMTTFLIRSLRVSRQTSSSSLSIRSCGATVFLLSFYRIKMDRETIIKGSDKSRLRNCKN
ncbi:hypothetical protein AAK979_07635, partial [Ileibacterium valens]|uniref:hypothetical protein n=1 Tax=Ileibacterium valens TaxID=1862668 RepID=UPI003511C732